jgi:hypothetical protein
MLALAQRAPPDVVIVDCALGEQASRRIAEAARAAGFGAVRETRPAPADVVASIESFT